MKRAPNLFELQTIRRLVCEQTGATAVEYGLMVAAIAAVIMLTVISIGVELDGTYTFVNAGLKTLTP